MLTIQEVTAQSLAEAAKVVGNGDLSKSITTATGLTGVRLDAAAKQLVPLMSPFRQSIPRMVKDGATASQWKAITGLSHPKLSVAEEAAGALFTTTVASKSASYKSMALRGKVTREAVAASQGFDPALRKETANTLLLAMKLEEIYILGGNVTATGNPAAPTLTLATTAGSLAPSTTTYYGRIVGLTALAANRVTINRPDDVNANSESMFDGAVVAAFASTDGLTMEGAEGNSGAQTGTSKALKVTWTPLAGCVAYAVFIGTSAGAANLWCQGIFTQTQVCFKTLQTSTTIKADSASIPAADDTADALSYDGIIPSLQAAGSGAYLRNLNAKLSQAGGEVAEVQEALAVLWDTMKLGKIRILVAGQEQRTITKLGILTGGGPTINVNPGDVNGRASIVQGYHVGYILNASTGDVCPVETMPWLPGGSILLLPMEIPYPDANQGSPFDMAMGFDWERWDYGTTSSTGPVYEFEVRCYGALRAIFTGGCGYIHNIHKS